MSLQDWTSVVEIAFYVVTGACVVIGLRSWRNEMKGRARYEAAKQFVAGAYRIRDAINRARSAYMAAEEWQDRQPVEGEMANEARVAESYFAYARRFNQVLDEVRGWYPALVQAEALFGSRVKELARDVNYVVAQLHAAVHFYHEDLKKQHARSARPDWHNILYGAHPGIAPDDPGLAESLKDQGFQKKLDETMKAVADFAAEHMT